MSTSPTNLTLVDKLDSKIWRAFVDHHPQGNIFHTPEMAEVFARAKGHQPAVYAALDGAGQVQALLPLVRVTTINGLLRRLTTRAIAYGGLLAGLDGAGEEALAALLKWYAEQHGREAVFTELRNLADTQPIQPALAEAGFAYEDHLDYLIDLDCTAEQMLQNIGSRTRHHIRQALRKGVVTLEEVTDREQLAVWYQVIQKTYRAAGVPLADRSLFEAALDVLRPQGMVVFWLARVGSAYASASVELLYKDVVYGWYGGMDRAYAKESPNEMMMWHIMDWGSRHGYKVYDFGGAGKPGETYGVRDFKAKFGGELVCFGRNKMVHSPHLLRWSEWGYNTYRHFRKRLGI